MTRAVPIVRGAPDKVPKSIGDRQPGVVTRHGLLAENLPSVLKQLRPMDATSAGLVRYLIASDVTRTRLTAL